MKIGDINKLYDISYFVDHIISGGNIVSLIEINPANISTLNSEEKVEEILKFEKVISGILTITDNFKLKVYDKRESMVKNIDAIKESKINEFVKTKKLEYFSDLTDSSTKGYVIAIYSTDIESKTIEISQVLKILEDNTFRPKLLKLDEILTFLRQTEAREFVDFDLMSLEKELLIESESSKKFQKLKSKDEELSIEVFKEMLDEAITNQISPSAFKINSNFIETNNYLTSYGYVKNYPTSTSVISMLNRLLINDVNLTLVFSSASTTKTLTSLESTFNKNQANRKGSQVKNIGIDVKNEQLMENIRKVREKNLSLVKCAIFIQTFAKDYPSLEVINTRVEGLLQTLNLTSENIKFEQMLGFNNSNLISSKCNSKFKRILLAETTANFFPFDNSTYNSITGMYLGLSSSGNHIVVDLFKRTNLITAPTVSIFGVSGMGKSYLLKKIICENYDYESSFYNIDPEGESIDIISKLSGITIDISSSKWKINPFEIRTFKAFDDEETDDELDEDVLFSSSNIESHLQWLKQFMNTAIDELTPVQLDVLMIAISNVYFQKGITTNTDTTKLNSTDYPIFSDVYSYIEKLILMSDEDFESKYLNMNKTTLRELLTRLYSFVSLGGENSNFNGHTNISNSNMLNFDCRKILEQSNQTYKNAMFFNLCSYIWSETMKNKQQGKKSIMITDELHAVINHHNPNLVSFYKNIIKRARKYQMLFVTATQDISDLQHESIKSEAMTILNSSSYKFIFHPSTNQLENTKDLFQLKNGEIDIIRNSERGNCLMIAGSEKYQVRIKEVGYEKEMFGTAGGL